MIPHSSTPRDEMRGRWRWDGWDTGWGKGKMTGMKGMMGDGE